MFKTLGPNDDSYLNSVSVPEVIETVRVSPPVIITPLQDVLVKEGFPALLQCHVSGEGTNLCSPYLPAVLLSCIQPSIICSCIIGIIQMILSEPCVSTVSPDLQVSWFSKDREVRQSDIFRMSHLGGTCQLEISGVLPEHEGEFSCLATNAAGMVTCAATLNLDGE